jgi:hypothetical protein
VAGAAAGGSAAAVAARARGRGGTLRLMLKFDISPRVRGADRKTCHLRLNRRPAPTRARSRPRCLHEQTLAETRAHARAEPTASLILGSSQDRPRPRVRGACNCEQFAVIGKHFFLPSWQKPLSLPGWAWQEQTAA